MHFLSLCFGCFVVLFSRVNRISFSRPFEGKAFPASTAKKQADGEVSHVALCTRHVTESSRGVKDLARARTATAEFLNGIELGIELYKRFSRQEWKTNNHVTRSFLVGSMTLASRFCSSAFVDKIIVVRIGTWPKRSVDWMP